MLSRQLGTGYPSCSRLRRGAARPVDDEAVRRWAGPHLTTFSRWGSPRGKAPAAIC